MNSKLSFILVIIIGIFLSALFSCNGTLVLFTIPFLTYLGFGLLFAPGDIRLSASGKTGHHRYECNQPVSLVLEIENEGAFIACLQVSPPAELKTICGEDCCQRQFSILNGQKIQLEYELRPPRGAYSWKTLQVVASDPFGLFSIPLGLQAEGHIMVLPRLLDLTRLKFYPHPNIRTAGVYLSGKAGPGIDFRGVREYHPGDSLRLIDWKKTARYPHRFFSQEYEGEEMADIGLLVDGRIATNRIFDDDSIFEHSIDAAATLAKHFLFSGNRVSMLLLSDHLVRILPGYGKGQLIRILDQLGQFKLGERITLETLRYLPVRLFPNQSVIVIISPLQAQDFSTIARLHFSGYQLLLVCPKPAGNIESNFGRNDLNRLAFHAARLEHKLLLRRFQQLGIRVIDWDVDRSLNQVLESARFIRR